MSDLLHYLNNRNQSINYFHTEVYEINILRLWALTVGIAIPIFGLFLLNVGPSSIDYISHRLLISAYWLTITFASFRKEFIKRSFILFSYIGNYLTATWVLWIVYQNNFSTNYSIGLILTLCCVGITFRNQKDVFLFFSYTTILCLIGLFISEKVETNKYILSLTMFILSTVYLIIIYQREYMTKSLASANEELMILNQTLESQVIERTKIAEDKSYKLEEKNKELERFASIASHDLKAPLRTVASFTKLLGKKTASLKDPHVKEFMFFIDSGIERMVKIIDDLLEYSRLGKSGVKFEPANLDRMLYIVLNSIVNQSNRSDIQVEVAPNLPVDLVCNSRQLEQLFQNLIDNAIKYNKSDIKKISITAEETKKHWLFKVKDNGIGIPQSHINQAFEMFKRLHSGAEFQGTGIGLAICKRIVETHNGKISIDSIENEGTTFIFTLAKNLPYNLPDTKSNSSLKNAPLSTSIEKQTSLSK